MLANLLPQTTIRARRTTSSLLHLPAATSRVISASCLLPNASTSSSHVPETPSSSSATWIPSCEVKRASLRGTHSSTCSKRRGSSTTVSLSSVKSIRRGLHCSRFRKILTSRVRTEDALSHGKYLIPWLSQPFRLTSSSAMLPSNVASTNADHAATASSTTAVPIAPNLSTEFARGSTSPRSAAASKRTAVKSVCRKRRIWSAGSSGI